jgi:type I restriction-modification system DNA methylase subunit
MSLRRRINNIKAASHERDMYAHIRDVLTLPTVGYRVENIVIDSGIGTGAPDLVIYQADNNNVIRKSEAFASIIIEVKLNDEVEKNSDAIFAEKYKYIQAGTKYFVLMDQTVVEVRDVYTNPSGPVVANHTWDEIAEGRDCFRNIFARLSAADMGMDAELATFRDGKTPFSVLDLQKVGRDKFIKAVREIAIILNEAIDRVIREFVYRDYNDASIHLQNMETKWGQAKIERSNGKVLFTFPEFIESSPSPQAIEAFEQEYEVFLAVAYPFRYALALDRVTLQDYAERLGFENEVSLVGDDENSRKAKESFVHETSSLLLARMLVLRFSEDNNFMQPRYISNGGVEVFAKYAKHFRAPYTELLRQVYRKARVLYHSLFDETSLDWILDRDENVISDAIEMSLYLLSRFDFKTVRGDVLSGVYDAFLEPSKRRRLGEVYTRPEIARYILNKCEYHTGKTVLDPACGTGTFLVEALESSLKELENRGVLDLKNVEELLSSLSGLDINHFAVALSQIQFFWHLFSMFKNSTQDEIKASAAALLPKIMIHGGESSLDTMGIPMARLQNRAIDYVYSNRMKHPVKFRVINRASYDLVVGNPPYVRAHRRSVPADLVSQYEEVAEGQLDLYIYFIYRAMRAWVKPGGRVGFIIPLAIQEAGYAKNVRQVMREFKILEILDLELLRKKVFGVKRPTNIIVLERPLQTDENEPHVEPLEDEVILSHLEPNSYEAQSDTIDFSKRKTSVIKRKYLFQRAYFPNPSKNWEKLVDTATNLTEEWCGKIKTDDVDILKSIAQCRRLGEIAKRAWRNKRNRNVQLTIPADPRDWEETMLIGDGLKLGGSSNLTDNGYPIYMGQNIFPHGLEGAPVDTGRWVPSDSRVQAKNLYLYWTLFDFSKLFAVRQISQAPTVVRHSNTCVFNNSVQVVQLDEDYPLDIVCLSRPLRFFVSKVLRAGIIEDLSSKLAKKQIAYFPTPTVDNKIVMILGRDLLSADADLANQYRHIDKAKGETTELRRFIARNNPVADGLHVRDLSDDIEYELSAVVIEGQRIRAGLLFLVEVPNERLRDFLCFELERLSESKDTMTKGEFLGIKVPNDLTAVLDAIKQYRNMDPTVNYETAQQALDRYVGQCMGLTDEQTDYIIDQYQTDPFLKELRPMVLHRGYRRQDYSDHSGEDRYA